MEKQHFSGEWGFIMAAAGAAVGLGNIWGFPRCFEGGGGLVFLGIYVLLNVLIGWPLLMAELAVGRDAAVKPRAAFRKLGKSGFGGLLGELASVLMMGFYSVLGGCCLRYMLINLAAVFRGGSGSGTGLFLGYISNVPLSAFFTVVFIAAATLIIMAGVSGGLERFARVAMPLLILMLPGLIICSMSLPGAGEGMKSIFLIPNRLSAGELINMTGVAFVQMFFSLSIGQAVMLTYGAYLPGQVGIPRCAGAVVLADTAIAILAAMAVLPAFHACGGAAGEGAMMLFVTMQGVFGSYGAWGSLFGTLFYLLVLLAALTSAVSLLEVISAFAGEGAGRKSSALFAGTLSAIPAVAIARDGMGFGALPEIMGMSWLDAAEFMSEGLLMPLCTLFMIRALWSVRGDELLRRQMGSGWALFVRGVMRYAAPPLIAGVMIWKLFGLR